MIKESSNQPDPIRIIAHGKYIPVVYYIYINRLKVYWLTLILGGGGVGKSFLILTISQWAERVLRKPGDNPDKSKVLLLGPTGRAASLIGIVQ